MAHKKELRDEVRNSYIYERLDLKACAEKHNVSYGSACNWKKNAKKQKDDWDVARNAARMGAGPAGDFSLQILEDFAIEYQHIMDAIRKDKELGPVKRTDLLTKLGDSYCKIMKIAGGNDDKIARLSIALDTLKRYSEFITTRFPHALEQHVVMLEQFSMEISKEYG